MGMSGGGGGGGAAGNDPMKPAGHSTRLPYIVNDDGTVSKSPMYGLPGKMIAQLFPDSVKYLTSAEAEDMRGGGGKGSSDAADYEGQDNEVRDLTARRAEGATTTTPNSTVANVTKKRSTGGGQGATKLTSSQTLLGD